MKEQPRSVVGCVSFLVVAALLWSDARYPSSSFG